MADLSLTRRVNAERAAALHNQIRAFLITTMPKENPANIAGALMYEIASLAAAISTSELEARHLIESLLHGAEEQIVHFGVGRPHP